MSELSTPVDGFRLAYDVVGNGPAVVLLHGWPGDRTDFRRVVPMLADHLRVVVPDLRGFGDSDRYAVPPAEGYSAAAQMRSVLGLLDDLGIAHAVFAGYDIGSRLIQTVVGQAPQRVRAAVLTPPLPGAGARLLAAPGQAEFWYQQLHRLPLADTLLDGRPDAVRAYLAHIWNHWSGPGFALTDEEFDAGVARYARPGAFTSSVGWYRSRKGSVASAGAEIPPAPEARAGLPVEVLWPEHDPLFPVTWADRLGDWYADLSVQTLPGSGHFVPLEAPQEFAAAVRRAAKAG